MRKKIFQILIAIVIIFLSSLIIFSIFSVRPNPKELNLVTDLLIRERRGFLSLVDDFLAEHPDYSLVLLDSHGNFDPKADLYLGNPNTYLAHNHRWANIPQTRLAQFISGLPNMATILPADTESNLSQLLEKSFLPLLWSPYGLFINQQVFLDRGLSIPNDWEQLTTLIPQLFGRPRPIPLGVAGPSSSRSSITRWLIGASDTTQTIFDQWLSQGYILPFEQEVEDSDLALLLADGRLAMVLGPLNFYAYLDPDQARAVGFFPFPGIPGQRPSVAARVVGATVVQGSEQKPVVQDFLAFLQRPETQEQWVSRSGNRITFNSLHRNARFPNEEGFRIAQLSRVLGRLWLE